MARDTPLVKVTCKSVHYVLSNPADGLINKQTNKHDQQVGPTSFVEGNNRLTNHMIQQNTC